MRTKKKFERITNIEHSDVMNMYLYGNAMNSSAKRVYFMSSEAAKEITKSKRDKLECFRIKSLVYYMMNADWVQWKLKSKIEKLNPENGSYLSLKNNTFNKVERSVWDRFELAIYNMRNAWMENVCELWTVKTVITNQDFDSFYSFILPGPSLSLFSLGFMHT